MLVYVNGDGHPGASYAVKDYAVSEDDFDLWYRGRQPHPANLAVAWPTAMRNHFQCEMVVESDIRNTAEDIVNQTTSYVDKNYRRTNLYVLIGFGQVNVEPFLSLSEYLKSINVRHIFYPTGDYIRALRNNGIQLNHRGYFGADGHALWSNLLSKELTKML
jgi:hypothetical protein